MISQERTGERATAIASSLSPPRPPIAPLLGATLLLALVSSLALFIGATDVAAGDVLRVVAAHLTGTAAGVTPSIDQIVWNIRVPRLLVAALVGAMLAVSGSAYQAVFRNPLAEPYLIGVAAGAGLGATAILVSPYTWSWHGLTLVTPAAFAGAIGAVLLAYLLGRRSLTAGAGLILAGVAIASLCNAASSLLYIHNETRIATVFTWLMGGFYQSTWTRVVVLVVYVVPSMTVVLVYARPLNVLLLDEHQARYLGIDVERVRLVVLAAASLGAAAAVSVSGLIGFVGLIVPHVARLIAGPDHRRMLPLAVVGGATLLIGADIVARTALKPVEIPVGIVTACVGGPFFLLLLGRRGRAAP